MVLLAVECRSFKRASLVMKHIVGFDVSPNTIERVAMEVGNNLEAARKDDWRRVITGEIPVPSLAVVEFDGGRIRTRKTGCGPGVHLDNNGWNESKNAIFVSATSSVSTEDPQVAPPACFLDRNHVAKLAEQAEIKENQGGNDSMADGELLGESPESDSSHRPKRLLRTVIASMSNSRQFGHQMVQEAKRRRFNEAERRAFVADGLTCNWTIHAEHFRDYVPVLDFTHAVSYLFAASIAVHGKTEAAWQTYQHWMTLTWQGGVREVLELLQQHQHEIGKPDSDTEESDPREQLRRVIGYLENNAGRMQYPTYRRAGLPTTSSWIESAIKEMNYRIKGTEMFWNNPTGAEAILQIRSAALSDDNRLVRLLTNRPGQSSLRKEKTVSQAA